MRPSGTQKHVTEKKPLFFLALPPRARQALDAIESELKDFKSQLDLMPPGAEDDALLNAGYHKRIANQLAAREKRLADTRAGIAQTPSK